MTIKHLFKLCILLFIFSCNSDYSLTKIEGKRIEISEEIDSDSVVKNFIKPYRENVTKNLDSVISYAPKAYSKSDGELNTAIGNLMADAVYSESNPIFKKRTGKEIDFVLLNYGGIRAPISKGDVTIRTAFEIMPFENSVVVVELKGEQVLLMTEYLSKSSRAHPLSKQFQLTVNDNEEVLSSSLNGKAIEKDKVYYVATNDYLYNGGNRMTFFHPNDSLYVLDYKIRNVLIDHFKKMDTLQPKIDNRYIKVNNQ